MKRPRHLLGTQEVADRLQVSVSTVKRWVDSGTIQAVKTPGRHRQIPLSEVERLARLLLRAEGVGVDADDWAARVEKGESDLNDQTRDLLTSYLMEGEIQLAKELVKTISRSGCGAAKVADDLIRPVMERIGHGWMVGGIDVFEEHQASQAIVGALHELIDEQSKQASPGPLAIGATIEGDLYVLSCLLGELLLRQLGWKVRNLGVCLPLKSLADAVLVYRPKLVYLSINHVRDESAFLREYGFFHQTADSVEAAVVVGGRALGPELRSKLLYTSYGERMSHLAEFARRSWSDASPTLELPDGRPASAPEQP